MPMRCSEPTLQRPQATRTLLGAYPQKHPRCLAVVALALAALVVACASEPAAPPPPAPQATGKDGAAPAPLQGPRLLLKSIGPIDFYPPEAKRAGQTGRVLVEYAVDPSGKATAVQVVRAEAPQALQDAALSLVRHALFDVSDPGRNAQPAPYYVSVSFCMGACGPLVPFPGYGDITITGHRF